jgi:hypothetical protein
MKFEELKATLNFDARACACSGRGGRLRLGSLPDGHLRVDFEHEALTFTPSEGFLQSDRDPKGLPAATNYLNSVL